MQLEKAKRFPEDFRSQDSWITDKGPHYCELCGYDVVTRTPEGELRSITFDAKYFDHLPGRRWHPSCALEDDRIQRARQAMHQAVAEIFA